MTLESHGGGTPLGMTTHVAPVDWSFADRPTVSGPTSHALARQVVVGPEQGAIHTELAVGALAPGGWLQRHFHSFEEALYVLAGELLVEIDGHAHRLETGDYTLMPVGTWHALGNPGTAQARWLSLSTPLSVEMEPLPSFRPPFQTADAVRFMQGLP